MTSSVGRIIDRIEEQLAQGRLVAYRLENVKEGREVRSRIVAIGADDVKSLLDKTDDFGIFEIDPEISSEDEDKEWSKRLSPMLNGRTRWSSTPWIVMAVSQPEQREAIAQGQLVPSIGVAACEADLILIMEKMPVLPDIYCYPEE